LDLQQEAKAAKKGRWSDDEPTKHIRNIQWNIEDPRLLVSKYSNKPVDAVVEQVIYRCKPKNNIAISGS
jgi:staphylococcal nuclease domain-containing protein 1